MVRFGASIAELSLMFAEPTINDFVELIDWHIANALKSADRAVNGVRGEFSKAGVFQSGRRIIFSIEAARKEFETGVEAVLGELKRTIRKNKLDPKDLRQHAGERLLKFANDAKAAAKVGGGLGDVSSLAAFDEHLKFALRQVDVGFRDPAEPETPPMTNAINIGTMTGSVIHQASPGATQTVEMKVDVNAVSTALSTLESELSKAQIDANAMTELSADTATIKAQLSKPAPSIQILQEAGRSVRNVVEGVAGGLLTPGVIAAVGALGAALGLN
jgi:hypothetical protein